MSDWVTAVNKDDLALFKKTVDASNINTYTNLGEDEYTPVLYLARISPFRNFKEMLEHCLELNADLSLKAKTQDCMGIMSSKRCTTIGNLASWRESKGWNGDPMGTYDLLVKMDKGDGNIFGSDLANQNALKWKKTVFGRCVSSTWKPGCGIPGIGVLSSARRTARFAGKAVVAAPVAVVGTVAGTGAAAVGVGAAGVASMSKAPIVSGLVTHQLLKSAFGGRKSRSNRKKLRSKSKSKSKSKKSNRR